MADKSKLGPQKTLWGTPLPQRAVDSYDRHCITLNEHTRLVDAVLVFDIAPRDDVGAEASWDRLEKSSSYGQRLTVLKQMYAIGLDLTQSLSVNQKQWIVRISARSELLETYAEKMGKIFQTKLLNDQEESNRGLLNGYAEFRVDKRHKYQMITTEHFQSIERQRIILYMIEKALGGNGEDMKMIKEAENSGLFHLFPTHEPSIQADLHRLWIGATSWTTICQIGSSSEVLDLVRNYYGEEISIYFAFLNFYTRALTPIAIFGVIVKLSQLKWGNDSDLVPAYCVAVVVWSIIFLEWWKTKEAMLQLRWNVREFEAGEVDRIDFKGEIRVSPITGEDELYFSKEARNWKYAVTGPILALSIVAVVIAAVGVVIFQYFAVHSGVFGAEGSLVAGVVNAAVIQLLNGLYESVAIYMNDYENHQTQTHYDDARIAKVFVFQFVNSYAAIIYMAFLAGRATIFGVDPKCTRNGCLSDIHNLIFATLMLNIVVGNLVEVMLPFISFQMEQDALMSEAAGENVGTGVPQEDTALLGAAFNTINPWYDEDDALLASKPGNEFALPLQMSKHEMEAHMPRYESTFSDYNELVIQFGYIVLFSMALPVGSLLCLINNLIEMRSDAFKLVWVYQRPFHRGAQDIGTWFLILRVMVVCGVLVNCGMMAFTSNIFLRNKWVDATSLGIVDMLAVVFVGEHIMFMLMVFCSDFIPDEPEGISDEVARMAEKAATLLQTKDDVDQVREKKRIYKELRSLIDDKDIALLEDIHIRRWRRTRQYGAGVLAGVGPPDVQDGEAAGKPAKWLEKRERQLKREEELKQEKFEYDLY